MDVFNNQSEGSKSQIWNNLAVHIVVNGEKFQSHCNLDLDQTIPNVKLVSAITRKCSSVKLIEPFYFSYLVHRHTDRKHIDTHRET